MIAVDAVLDQQLPVRLDPVVVRARDDLDPAVGGVDFGEGGNGIGYADMKPLYDQLRTVSPSPVVALNRAVAVAQLSGPGAALELLDDLDLDHYQRYHAIRADLLRRLNRTGEAKDAYQTAITLTDNPSERRFLQRRIHALTAQQP